MRRVACVLASLGLLAACNALTGVTDLSTPRRRPTPTGASATSPSARFTHGTLPYVDGDGLTIANDWLDLTDGSLRSGIEVDELGGLRANSVWTATNSNNGTYTGQSCADLDVFDARAEGALREPRRKRQRLVGQRR